MIKDRVLDSRLKFGEWGSFPGGSTIYGETWKNGRDNQRNNWERIPERGNSIMNAIDENEQGELRGREIIPAGERWGWTIC